MKQMILSYHAPVALLIVVGLLIALFLMPHATLPIALSNVSLGFVILVLRAFIGAD